MTLRMWAAAGALVALTACGGGDGDGDGVDNGASPADTGAAAAVPTQTTPATTPAPPSRPAVRPASAPLVDEPWFPTDTGTVAPGMSIESVVAVWGEPIVERHSGQWSYLYYRNGCEVTCGTFDVVFFENGQVVDAVVRGPGHTYAGVSSSPPERVPEATVAGEQTS